MVRALITGLSRQITIIAADVRPVQQPCVSNQPACAFHWLLTSVCCRDFKQAKKKNSRKAQMNEVKTRISPPYMGDLLLSCGAHWRHQSEPCANLVSGFMRLSHSLFLCLKDLVDRRHFGT